MAVPLFFMKVLSLFSNAGFGEFYLRDHGFDVVVANELLLDRVEFYSKFNPDTKSVICGDICQQNIQNKIIKSCEDFGPIDLVIATPPCQGMSIANAQRETNDVRNKLIVHAMNIFNKVGARYMLIENVPGMINTYINYKRKPIKIIDFIKSKLPENFTCRAKVLNGKHFGTAQSRSRSICLISPNGEWKHPIAEEKVLTLRDAIGDHFEFPTLESGQHSSLPWHFAPKHNARHIQWMSATPEGETAFNNKVHYPQKDGRKISGFKTTYKRMSWGDPAPTVTMTNGSISSQNNVHPGYLLPSGLQSNARVLTIREILSICGLPTDCLDKFCDLNQDGSYTYHYRPNFIRKILGELFLPKMCLSILKSLPDTNEIKTNNLLNGDSQLEFQYD